jgi:hypothetical protein
MKIHHQPASCFEILTIDHSSWDAVVEHIAGRTKLAWDMQVESSPFWSKPCVATKTEIGYFSHKDPMHLLHILCSFSVPFEPRHLPKSSGSAPAMAPSWAHLFQYLFWNMVESVLSFRLYTDLKPEKQRPPERRVNYPRDARLISGGDFPADILRQHSSKAARFPGAAQNPHSSARTAQNRAKDLRLFFRNSALFSY